MQMAELAAAVGATPETLAKRLDELGGGTRLNLDPEQCRLVAERALAPLGAGRHARSRRSPPADLEALLEAATAR